MRPSGDVERKEHPAIRRSFLVLIACSVSSFLSACSPAATRTARTTSTITPAPTVPRISTTSSPSPPDPPPPGPLYANGRAWSGHGALAFVSRNRLYVLDNRGRLTPVMGPSTAGGEASPKWSSDGQWLAFISTRPSAALQGAPLVGSLWVLHLGSTAAQLVTSADVAEFAWSPVDTTLLAYETTYTTGVPQNLYLTEPGSPPARLSSVQPFLGGFAWSPDGTHLAVVTGHAGNGQGEGPLSAIQVAPVAGGPPVTWEQSSTDGFEVDGWWPNGGGLLYWLDVGYSASIAADGLTLYSQAAGKSPKALAATLVNPSWVSWSPDGTTVAIVAGGGRFIWSGGKHVDTCDPVTATCSPIDSPSGVVELSPTWAPNGALWFITASDTAPFTNGLAYFTPGWMAAWFATHHFNVLGPTGVDRLQEGGVVLAAKDVNARGTLGIQDDYVVFGPVGGPAAQIAGPLFNTVAPTGYYGQIDWNSTFAWYQR